MSQDREQTLAAIDSLLSQQPITSEHLTSFRLQHPDVVGGQQGSKEDLSLTADSEELSDIVLLCDSVNLSVADSVSVADTSSSTAEHNVSYSSSVTRRHHSHRSDVAKIIIIIIIIIKLILVVLMAQWLSVGLGIERLLVRLPAGARYQVN